MRHVPLITFRGSLWGCDWGQRDIKVIVDSGTAKLLWSPGGTHWSGMHGTTYSPSHMAIVRDSLSLQHRLNFVGRTGGRLTQDRLRESDVQAAVMKEWGGEVATLLDPSKTLVL